ncbi:MAG TPA: molybdate ABC transporter substrate-binding protein [bacterium]|nr:molybdate ABC transporter substrate-binding protein [bacterium]
MVPRRIVLPLLLAVVACAGCARDDPRSLTVFAAASLTSAFEQLAHRFEQTHAGVHVDLHTAGTPRLVLQIQEGAQADVFASADEAQMQRIVAAGMARGQPIAFAYNSMTLITPRDRAAIQSLRDLQSPRARVLLCAPSVPAGRYARAVLAKAGIDVRSVSDEPNVRAVIAKVRLGLVDAAIVYRSDARGDTKLRCLPIDAADNVRTTYPVVTLRDARSPELAERFVRFVLGETGRQVLAENGFDLP